ncbi:C40 family peptidase [Agromyces sp. G08B096]|uniref:C40 family peptidase n=1 Tax=Agromyces sp. G08B096 TaxID=3156399 RepID=A0AAU7W9E9_9MICO
MPIIEALGRIDEITRTVAALEGREVTAPTGRSDSAAAFAPVLAAQQPSTVGAAPGAGAATGRAIVDEAKTYLGVPYVLGGNDRSGIDCSGLVQQVLGTLGIEAPRRVSQQQHIGTEVGSLAEAQPGDLIVTHNADHVVIYAGDGMIVHAPYEGRTVSYQPNYLTDADIQTIRRVAPAEPAPAAASAAPIAASAMPAATSLAGAGIDRQALTDLLLAAQLQALLRSAS